jgi:hypothetical protein
MQPPFTTYVTLLPPANGTTNPAMFSSGRPSQPTRIEAIFRPRADSCRDPATPPEYACQGRIVDTGAL